MKHTWKKAAAGLLALTMLTGGVPAITPAQDMLQGAVLTAHAAEVVASGTCGDAVSWTLDDEGTLTISGTGEMADYASSEPGWAIKKGIKRVVVKNGVTHIGAFAFFNSDDIEKVSLPESLETFGMGAFKYCPSLTSVTIPEKVLAISEQAFYGCTSLTSVTIPEKMESIGEEAFYDCSALESITIPENVSGIADSAFGNCSSLKTVTMTGLEPPTLGDNVFLGSDDDDNTFPLDAEIVVPFASVGEYQQAEGWKDLQLASKIPDSGVSQYYRQTAENDGTFYTRFVFVVSKADFRGADSVRYTVTDDRTEKEYTVDSDCYYTGMTSNKVHYIPAEDDSALFIVTVGSNSDISDNLTCALSFS